MRDDYNGADLHWGHYERLTALAAHRHAATAACYRLAAAAKTPEDRARYEDMARRSAGEGEALERRIAAAKSAAV